MVITEALHAIGVGLVGSSLPQLDSIVANAMHTEIRTIIRFMTGQPRG
jgi:hypothetical protein